MGTKVGEGKGVKHIEEPNTTRVYKQKILPKRLNAPYIQQEYSPAGKIYNLGTLPEVVVRPTASTRLSQYKMRRMFPNTKDLSDITNTAYKHGISEGQLINRLYDVYENSGAPKLKSVQWWTRLPIVDDIMENGKRPYNIPGTNTIRLYKPDSAINVDSYIDELAHSYLRKQIPLNKRVHSLDYFLPSDFKIGDKDGYKRPTHYEYQTHSIVKPALENYIYDNYKLYKTFDRKGINDVIIEAIKDSNK